MSVGRRACYRVLGRRGRSACPLIVVGVAERGRQADALLSSGAAIEVKTGSARQRRACFLLFRERQERVFASSGAGAVGSVAGDAKRGIREWYRRRRRGGQAPWPACCRRREISRSRVGRVPETRRWKMSRRELRSGAAGAEGRMEERVRGSAETPSQEVVAVRWQASSDWHGSDGRRICGLLG